MTMSRPFVRPNRPRSVAPVRPPEDMPDDMSSGQRARPIVVDESALVQALREGEGWAERALLDRYGAHVERILTRILGAHVDLDDLALEVFVRAFQRLSDLREADALRS